MQLLEQLSPEDQSLLLQYFGLGKTQSQIAGWHCTGQTIVSTGIRMAVRRFGTVLLLGPLNIRTIRSILTASGLEGGLDRPLSTAVRLYSGCRSVQVVANVLHLKRSDVRLAMRRATKVLLASSNGLDRALGAYMHDLVDKASVYGTGAARYSKRSGAISGCEYCPWPGSNSMN